MGEKRSKAGANRRSHKKRAQPAQPRAYGTASVHVVTKPVTHADPEHDGISKDLPALPTSNTVVIRTDAAKRRITGARRQNVFDLLASTKGKDGAATLNQRHVDAVDRLAKDLAMRTRTMGSGGAPSETVDCERKTDPMDGMLAAGDRVDAVLAMTGEASAVLLLALLDGQAPEVRKVDPIEEARLAKALRDWHIAERLRKAMPAHDRPEAQPFPGRVTWAPWRQIVATVTGITLAGGQSVPIVIACQNLVAAYAKYDQGARPAIRLRIDA